MDFWSHPINIVVSMFIDAYFSFTVCFFVDLIFIYIVQGRKEMWNFANIIANMLTYLISWKKKRCNHLIPLCKSTTPSSSGQNSSYHCWSYRPSFFPLLNSNQINIFSITMVVLHRFHPNIFQTYPPLAWLYLGCGTILGSKWPLQSDCIFWTVLPLSLN